MPQEKVERELADYFYKTVGVELGYYDRVGRKIRSSARSESPYLSTLDAVRQALSSGWQPDEIRQVVTTAYRNGVRTALITGVIDPSQPPKGRIGIDDNLIDTRVTYRHPALYLRTYPRYRFEGDQPILSVTPHQEPRREFTLNDLVDYYCMRFGIAPSPGERKKIAGGFRWILEWESPRLDELLYAIDFAADAEELPLVLRLTDYLPQGREEVRIREARVGSF